MSAREQSESEVATVTPLTPAARAEAARTNLVGASPAFMTCVRLIERLAGCEATVLIQGETGTGKELAARAIHYLGARRSAPFIPVNCGAVPDTLVESEFFGHVRGAFTDARDARAGVVAQAESGTLYLDEIEALSPRAQVALLRFLQDHEYRPVGGSVTRDADVRVVASSNVDLGELVGKGAFRADLLFRLNVLPLCLPPLRERGGDAALLADVFLERFSRQYRQPEKALDAASRAWLERHDWPGNVRELENLIHRQFLLSDSNIVRLVPEGAQLQSATVSAESKFREAKERAIAEFERGYIVALLARTRGNLSLAARISGKERSGLGKMLKKYGVDRARFEREAAGESNDTHVRRRQPTT